jgi:hypothetical protein
MKHCGGGFGCIQSRIVDISILLLENTKARIKKKVNVLRSFLCVCPPVNK